MQYVNNKMVLIFLFLQCFFPPQWAFWVSLFDFEVFYATKSNLDCNVLIQWMELGSYYFLQPYNVLVKT